jgi:hypothetical protein
MTMPSERTRAVLATRRFLKELCNNGNGLEVPASVRESARRLLRHYPDSWHIDIAAVAWPMAWAPASPRRAPSLSYLDLLALTTTVASTEAGEGADLPGKTVESDDATS